MDLKNELEIIRKMYGKININFEYKKRDVSSEIKIFEEMCGIELPPKLKELYSISDGFEEAFCSYKCSDVKIGVIFRSFQNCKEDFNIVPEYWFLQDNNSPVWSKVPQVDRTTKTKFKFEFAIDNLHAGGHFYIDYQPSKFGKKGQILFMTSEDIYYICDNFDEFLCNGIVQFKAKFNDINWAQVYGIKMKKILSEDDLEAFKKNYRPDNGVRFIIENSVMLIVLIHELNSQKILNYILNELKYPKENYLVDAILIGNTPLCEQLLSQGIDVNKITDYPRRHSLLRDITLIKKKTAVIIAEKLIKMGADINYVGLGENTILDELYWSAANGLGGEDMISLFEKYGAKYNDPINKEVYNDHINSKKKNNS